MADSIAFLKTQLDELLDRFVGSTDRSDIVFFEKKLQVVLSELSTEIEGARSARTKRTRKSRARVAQKAGERSALVRANVGPSLSDSPVDSQ